jgi:WD40 repeat protein
VTENYNQPRPDDAVLGDQKPQPLNAVVLGGIKGVKRCLVSSNVEQKTAALEEALKYGQEGLELLMHALKDEEWQVRRTSYALLQKNVEPELKQALEKYNPYLPLNCFDTLTGHSEPVVSIAFSRDGSTLATGSRDKTIKLWDIGSGELKSTLTGHSDSVGSIVFSRDGKTLASRSDDNTIKFWDIGSGELKSTLTAHSIAFSSDGSTLASGSNDNTIKLWDIGSGELKSILPGHSGSVGFLVFSRDGKTLASCSNDNTIKFWDIGSGELKSTLIRYPRFVKAIVLSPDGSILASYGSGDQTIKLWDIGSGELKSTLIGHSDSVRSIAFSPDGKTLASCSYYDKTIKLWDIGSGELKSTLNRYSLNGVDFIAFSPDGSTLASCSSGGNTIKLWDIGSGELKRNLTAHSASVGSIVFSRDGKTLASRSNNTIKLWKPENLNQSKLDLVKFFHCYIVLKEALKSGKVGLDKVIHALKGESWEVHEAAYSLLVAKKFAPRIKQALQEYTRCKLNSEVNVDYARLRYLLATQRWKEAEEETEDIMLKISGHKTYVDLNHLLNQRILKDDLEVKCDLKCRIPNEDLHTIYDLWREYSNVYSHSFSQQKLHLNFWMTVKTQLEEIFKHQERISLNYGADRVSAEYGEAMRNRD